MTDIRLLITLLLAILLFMSLFSARFCVLAEDAAARRLAVANKS